MKKNNPENLLIGIHPVEAALAQQPDQVKRVIVALESKNPRTRELEQQARGAGLAVESRKREQLDRLSDGQRHQDIIAEFVARNIVGEKDLDRILDAMPDPKLVLILDGVQDPHNLGACLRTADAAGAGMVIMTRDGSAGLSPVARRAAAGAAEVIPILMATNLARVLRRLKEKGIWLAGTTDGAEQDIYQADLAGPLGLVMGSEGKGMRRLTADLCDFQVHIPMQGTVSSLNVSVATGICLYEINRQRSAG